MEQLPDPVSPDGTDITRPAENAAHAAALAEQAVDEERRRIAGEIHDALNTSLLLIRNCAEAIAGHASKAEQPDIEAMSRKIVDMSNEAYTHMRRVAKGLRPEVLDVLGLAGAIAALARDFGAAHPRCRFIFNGCTPAPKPPPAVAMAAYRVAQEALNNSVKHASASQVTVSLEQENGPHRLRLIIADNGQGAQGSRLRSGGLGLIGMRERVAVCGGEFSVVSGPTGTVVTAVI
jgi:signal transduction histidine kinase